MLVKSFCGNSDLFHAPPASLSVALVPRLVSGLALAGMTPWPSMVTKQGEVHRGKDGAIESVQGMMNYQGRDVEKVVARRDLNGSDSGLEGAVWEATCVDVRNGRPEALTLDANGFELRMFPVSDSIDFYNQASIVDSYFPTCEELVKASSGAAFVKAFDYNVRSAGGETSGKRIDGGSQVQAPASLVHGDYTLASAPRRVAMLGEPPKSNDVLREQLQGMPLLPKELCEDVAAGRRRWGIINVWRSITIEPVRRFPLACVDSSSMSPGSDLVTFEIHYADRVGENYFSRANPAHRWRYFPEMRREEALVLKQWDSHGALARSLVDAPGAAEGAGVSTFALHSAFADPTSAPGAPDRESIEVRCVAVW